MAASANDKFMKTGTSTATTLSAPGYTIGNTSITVGSTTNWPTDTGVVFAIDVAEVVDGEQVRVAGTYCEFQGTVASGTSINNLSLTLGTPQNYSAGSLTRVYIPVSSEREERLIDGILTEHDQDGTHGNITTGTIAASGVITASTHIDVNDSSTAIRDSSDNELIKFAKTASAVNEITVTNAAAGSGPTISATGGDTNVDLNLAPKGTGKIKGIVQNLYNPYKFRAWRNAAANTGNGAFAQIVFDTENYDTNNNFASGQYTVPVDGFYLFNWNALATLSTGADEATMASLFKNGSEISRGSEVTALSINGSHGSDIIQCTAGDVMTIQMYAPTTRAILVGSQQLCYFSGIIVSST